MSKTTTSVKNPRIGKVLVIKRSKWVRGDNPETQGISELLNDRGRMCCLGFDAKACGVRKSNLQNIGDPATLVQDVLDGYISVPTAYIKTTVKVETDPYNEEYKYSTNSNVVDAAIATNDASNLTEKQRESRIRKYLIKLGWKDVKFVN